MNWQSFWDNPEEIFIGVFLQFPLFYVVGWKIAFIMAVCGVFWRLGGWEHGSKLWRRIGVPLVVCGATFLTLHHWTICLAGPFMVWLAPSYGKEAWLYKRLGGDNFLTRIICYGWYWAAFSIAFILK